MNTTKKNLKGNILAANTWTFSQNNLVIFQKFHRVQNCLYACKSWCECIFKNQCSVSHHWFFHRNDKCGHLEQFCRKCVYFHFQLTYLVCANLCPYTLIWKFNNSSRCIGTFDTFTPRASIQWILDSLEFLENYEIILALFSSSCVYMLSFSFFAVVFIFCKVGQMM